MASLGGIDAYMEQWLKTATKGNVRFTMAFLTNRMHLHCDVCNVGMTCTKPADANTIDFAVQEYVKLHAHKGGFGDEWKCEMCDVWTKEPLTGPSGHGTTCKAIVHQLIGQQVECTHKKADGVGSTLIKHQMVNGDVWTRCMRCGAQWNLGGSTTAVTADFKDLPSKHSLPIKSGSVIHPFDIGDALIDEKPQNAAIIQQQMQKYDASQMTDYQLAKKIAELQKKKQQLQQLELQEVQAKLLWAKSQLKNIPTVTEHVPAKPATAPVTDVFEDKGRKFR